MKTDRYLSDFEKLKPGTCIKIMIPFEYEIGEEAPTSREKLLTIEDCIKEVENEFTSGQLGCLNVYIEIDGSYHGPAEINT